jgi:hypothetical protein
LAAFRILRSISDFAWQEVVQESLSGLICFFCGPQVTSLGLRTRLCSHFAILGATFSRLLFGRQSLSRLLRLLRNLCYDFENTILLGCGILGRICTIISNMCLSCDGMFIFRPIALIRFGVYESVFAP